MRESALRKLYRFMVGFSIVLSSTLLGIVFYVDITARVKVPAFTRALIAYLALSILMYVVEDFIIKNLRPKS